MDIKELRVGSTIINRGVEKTVDSKFMNLITEDSEASAWEISYSEPIILTKEYLLSKGFNEWVGYLIYEKEGIQILIDDKLRLTTFDDTILSKPIESFHVFQNLYFFLTKTEFQCTP